MFFVGLRGPCERKQDHKPQTTNEPRTMQLLAPPMPLRGGLALLVVVCVLLQVLLLSTSNAIRAIFIDENVRKIQTHDHSNASSASASALPVSFDTTSIRKWGCNMNATPFIFVHIGKAGGGGVRARFAASALNYSKVRGGWFAAPKDKTYYYPVYDSADGQTLYKGRFATSRLPNWLPPSLQQYRGDFTWETIGNCSARTPLGQAVGCPWETDLCLDPGNSTINRSNNRRCDLVCMGHNVIGNELHWLPSLYLKDWWEKHMQAITTTWSASSHSNTVDVLAKAILFRNQPVAADKPWKALLETNIYLATTTTIKMECPDAPHTYNVTKHIPSSYFEQCTQPKSQVVDQWSDQIFGTGTTSFVGGPAHTATLHYAHMISTLPVTRVTVVREPFSWLLSKFFWHGEHYRQNMTTVKTYNGRNVNRNGTIECDNLQEAGNGGWAATRSITYMVYLCGEHCWAGGQLLSLEDIEIQAAYNLRNSFAVVGLLQDTPGFYEMVRQRVYYMDTRLNPDVVGKTHSTKNLGKEVERCREIYRSPDFQNKLMEQAPEVAAMIRLYKIALEVNAFQKKELESCSRSDDQ